MRLKSLFVAVALCSSAALASILPPNDLHLEDDIHRKDANINEALFGKIIDDIMEVYRPIVESHGATLQTNKKWTDSTVNASAQQLGDMWIINMFGGLARRPEVTPDGFALVVCHELGHHLAGFPFYGERWAASEGQSDYFATHTCAQAIWGDQHEINARFRDSVHPVAKTRCDAVWSSEREQNICYRSVMGGYSLAHLLGSLRKTTPDFNSPDANQVTRTSTSHPAAQCRLDTYTAGALCPVSFDRNTIPGRSHADGQESEAAEMIASQVSCTRSAFFSEGLRPRCWFKPNVKSLLRLKEISWSEKTGNGNDVVEPGETVDVTATLENLAVNAYSNITATLNSVEGLLDVTSESRSIGSIYPRSQTTLYQPFTAKVSDQALCGAKVNLGIDIKVDDVVTSMGQSMRLGQLIKTEGLSNSEAQEIPDNDKEGILSAIAVPGEDHFGLAQVQVDITHPYRGDLTVTLLAPSGQSYVLHQRKGGSKDHLKATFDVEFTNAEASGDWKLHVVDSARSDKGQFNSWSLTLSKAVCE